MKFWTKSRLVNQAGEGLDAIAPPFQPDPVKVDAAAVDPESAEAQLARIASSAQFEDSPRLVEFLRYVGAGKCMAWKNILDLRRAVDYLCTRPEVKADRIGCYGHSMGSTHTWLVGPWEPRLVCLVGNCCLPTYAAIERTHILHCFPNFIPGWAQYGDTPDIAGLIAPRALHLNFGEQDGGSPVTEVRAGLETIARAYDQAGASARFSHYTEAGAGHILSDEMWQRARAWFRTHLSA